MTPDSPAPTPKPAPAGLSVEALMRELEAKNQRIRFLELELRLLRIKHFGASSEKLSDGQLELMEGEPSVEKAEIESEAALLPEAKESADRQLKHSRQGIHPGREPISNREINPGMRRRISCFMLESTPKRGSRTEPAIRMVPDP